MWKTLPDWVFLVLPFVLGHAAVEEKECEGEQRSDEHSEHAEEGPLGFLPGDRQGDAEEHEQDSVRHSHIFYGERLGPDVLQGHGDKHQQQVGHAFPERNLSQEWDWVFHRVGQRQRSKYYGPGAT